jgi:hypothetical protein
MFSQNISVHLIRLERVKPQDATSRIVIDVKTSNLINGKLKEKEIPSVAGWKGHLDDCGYWYLL